MKRLLCSSFLAFSTIFPATNACLAQSAAPLFTLLSPKQTRITFNNKLEDTREHNIMIYSNFYGGAGVGVGDRHDIQIAVAVDIGQHGRSDEAVAGLGGDHFGVGQASLGQVGQFGQGINVR